MQMEKKKKKKIIQGAKAQEDFSRATVGEEEHFSFFSIGTPSVEGSFTMSAMCCCLLFDPLQFAARRLKVQSESVLVPLLTRTGQIQITDGSRG